MATYQPGPSATTGNDTISGVGAAETINGLAGVDTLQLTANYSTPNNIINVEVIQANVDTGLNINWSTSTAAAGITLLGAAGADSLTGSSKADYIDGKDGNDVIAAGIGNDFASGGLGNDTIGGGKGFDTLLGGAGADSLAGAQNDDVVRGGDGDDTLDETRDTGVVNPTTSELSPAGNNLLTGDAGNDTIWGGFGSDQIRGGVGDDVLLGNGGNDVIYTGAGTDIVFGGLGSDTININASHAATTLVYNTNERSVDGVDEIYGFTRGVDKIQLIDKVLGLDPYNNSGTPENLKLNKAGIDALALSGDALTAAVNGALANNQEVDGADRILTLANGSTLVFKNIGASLTTADFLGYTGAASLSVPSPSVDEGNSGTTAMTFNLSFAQPSGGDYSLNYETLTTGTATAGNDFVANSGTIPFVKGQQTATLTVLVNGDTAVESNETVQVKFWGEGLEPVIATGTIKNDDTQSVFVMSPDVTTVTEGNAVTFTVTASPAVTADTTLSYNISGDTKSGALTAATAADFGTLAGSFTIPAGQTKGTFTIIPTSDGVAEGLEGFKVSLFDKDLNNVASSSTLAIADGASSGQTFTLTTAPDNITGTAGNDTISGTLAFTNNALASSATLTPGDQIDGGVGTDTLSVIVSGSDVNNTGTGYTYTPNVTNVEKILVANLASDKTDPVTFDLSLAGTGLTNIGTNQSTSVGVATKFTNAPLIATEMAGRGDLNVAFSSTAVSGTADAVTLTLNGVGAVGTPGLFTTAGVETLNVASALTANNVELSGGASLKTVNVSGNKSVFIDANAASNTSLTTVNASTATGAVSIDASGASSVTTLTLGAGGGTIYVGSDLGSAQTITGGSGNNDTLAISYDPDPTATASVTLSTAAKSITGIERLEVTSTDTDGSPRAVNVSGISGITTVATGNVAEMTYDFNTATTANPTTVSMGINGSTIQASVTTTTAAGLATAMAAAINSAGIGVTASVVTGLSAVTSAAIKLTSAANSGISITAAPAAVSGTYTANAAALESHSTYDTYFSNLAANTTLEIFGGAGGQELTSGVLLDGISATLKDGSGTADAMTVNLKAGAGIGMDYTVATLTVDSNLEALTINAGGNLASANKHVISTLTAPGASKLTVTGNNNLTIGATTSSAVLKTVDASALTGDFSYTTAVGTDLTITGGSGNDTIALGTTLNNKDTVDAGAGTKDVVSGDVTGLSSTTGALNISNAETINLTTSGDNTINAAGIKGATLLAVTDYSQTITNLAAGVKIGVGLDGDAAATSSTVNVALADATGTADALTFNINNANGAPTTTLKTTAIESVTLAVGAATGSASNDPTINLANVTASAITVTGGLAGTTVTTNGSSAKLNAATTTFDASAFLGNVLADASAASKAVTLSANGSATSASTLVGSNTSSTFNISETGALVHTVTAGTGTGDTLNIGVKNGFVDTSGISGVEIINFTVRGGDIVAVTNAGGENTAKTINVLGGNSLSVFTTGTLTTTPTVLDASTFAGKLDATFGDDFLDSTVTVKGGSLTTDQVTASYATLNTTYAVKTSGIEVLDVTGGNVAGIVVDLANASGLATVKATESYAQTLKIQNLAAGVGVTATQGNAGSVLQLVLADATGTADALTVTTGSSPTAGAKLQVADVENLTIKAANTATYDLSSVTMTDSTATTTLKVTGSNALTISSLGTAVTTVDGSGMDSGGSVILGARSLNSAMTFTGSSGNDTAFMQNSADVLNGGSGSSDTLKISSLGSALASGIFVVDLSSTTDQVTTYNGTANSAVQVGFENIDFSGLATGTSFGAQVTAASGGSAITGTTAIDNFTGGIGADTFNGGAGADVMTGGGGNDVFVYTATSAFVAGNAVVDSITGGDGTDTILFQGTAITIGSADVLTRVGTVERLAIDTQSSMTLAHSITITSSSNLSSIRTIDLSADGSSGSTGNIVLTGVSVGTNLLGVASGQNTVIGGSGNDTIKGGSVVDSIEGAGGADSIMGGGGADVIWLGSSSGTGTDGVADTLIYTATNFAGISAEGGDHIKGFENGSDVIQFASGLLLDTAGVALTNAGLDVQSAAANANFASLLADPTSDGIIQIIGLSMTTGGTIQPANVSVAASVAAVLLGTVDGDQANIFAIDNGTDTVLWYFDATATNTTGIDASELKLIGVLDGVTGTTLNSSSFSLSS